MSVHEMSAMIGATLDRVEGGVGAERMTFHATDGRAFSFYHAQDCCENVRVEDVCGDLSDLVGSPIVQAEEVSNADEPATPEHADSFTWTFYKYATSKGAVTVRWLGESNGYYSEGVDFDVEAPPACTTHEDCRATYELGRACLLAASLQSGEEK